MGKQYMCEYCKKGFPDNRSARYKHLKSAQHLMNRKKYYFSFLSPLEIYESTYTEKEKINAGNVCKQYAKLGKCEFGVSCRYSHFNTNYIERLLKERKTTMMSKSVEHWVQEHLLRFDGREDVVENKKKESSSLSNVPEKSLPPSMRIYRDTMWAVLPPIDWG